VALNSVRSIDLSKSPSIQIFHAGGSQHFRTLESVNLSNCVNLERITIPGGLLTDLDLSDCRALIDIHCCHNSLPVLDINLTNNPAIWGIDCWENHLLLSNLYALSELSDEQYPPFRFGRQTLGEKRIKLGDALDYSSQKEFGGVPTDFYVILGAVVWGATPNSNFADPSMYNIDNGVITFHSAKYFTVDMRNDAIKQDILFTMYEPARCLVGVNVIDFVPVAAITNVPASVSVGEQYIFSNYNIVVLPENATYKQATWEVTDAGTTGAIIFGTRLITIAPGIVKVRGTIKDGLDFDEDYTQDFVIEVTPLSIDEAAQGLETIEVYPNPTTGELFVGIAGQARNDVRSVEVFDVSGRSVLSHTSYLTPQTVLNISHLQAGTYFVKIVTEQGEVVRKVVKQ